MSDAKLYQELKNHIDKHVERFDKHEQEDIMKFDKLVAAQHVNTEAITVLTISVSSLVDNTSSIVELHRDFQGAANIGTAVQKFMLWFLKWGVIGASIYAGLNWVFTHFKN